jgi:hypothetical protein
MFWTWKASSNWFSPHCVMLRKPAEKSTSMMLCVDYRTHTLSWQIGWSPKCWLWKHIDCEALLLLKQLCRGCKKSDSDSNKTSTHVNPSHSRQCQCLVYSLIAHGGWIVQPAVSCGRRGSARRSEPCAGRRGATKHSIPIRQAFEIKRYFEADPRHHKTCFS